MSDTTYATRREPPPAPGTVDVLPLVLADLQARADVGRVKYGTTLQVDNGRDHLVDAYQEVLDLVVYLRAEFERRQELEAESERRRLERADALNVHTREGLLASEWVLRTGQAERRAEAAEARAAELEEDRSARIDAAHEFEATITDLSARVAELEALLRDVRYRSGIVQDDKRIGYVLAQIDRVLWDALADAVK